MTHARNWLRARRAQLNWSHTPLGIAIAVVVIPLAIVPNSGVDSSWATGLVRGRLEGMSFGDTLMFTYGPWVFLDEPVMLSLPVLAAAAIARAAASAIILVLSYRALRRSLTPWAASVITAAIGIPVLSVGSIFSAQVVLVSILVALALVQGQRVPLWALALVAAVAGATTTVKFSNGVLAVATLGLGAVVAAAPWRLRALRTGIVAAAAASALPIAWLVGGQSLADLAPWLRGSLELTSGYSEAMSTEAADALVQYGIFALLVLGVVASTSWSARTRTDRIPLIIVISWIGLMALRLGFTRHDLGHPLQSFDILAVTALALATATRVRVAIATAAIASIAALAAVGSMMIDVVDPAAIAERAQRSSVALLSGGYRGQELGDATASLQAHYALEPQILDALAGRSVHVDPVDANVTWAYGLDWSPVPVIQAYSAYTPYLDQLDADALRDADGPDSILRASLYGVDGRNPMWESPAYMVAMFCNFRPAAQSDRWLVLDRTPDRCRDATSLGTASLSPGYAVDVPAPSQAGSMVVARLDLDPDPLNAVASAVFKPVRLVEAEADGETYRLPRQHAGGPLLMHVPEDSGWGANFGGGYDVGRLSLNVSGTVTFLEIPVS